MVQSQTSLGKRVRKADALERVVGEARYSADFSLPGMLYGKILRSPHAHARIRRIDYTKALQLPGVVSVITAGDFRSGPTQPAEVHAPAGTYDPGHEEEHAAGSRPNGSRTVFAGAKALWAGQPVAAVAATSLQAAEEALGLIEVSYEVLKTLETAEEAMKPDAPLLHPNLFTTTLGKAASKPSNVATYVELVRGDLERGFREADVVIEDTYRTGMVHQGYLEPRATLAKADPDGKVTIWSSSQGSFGVQQQAAEILNLPLDKINVIPTEIGGGFGSKGQGVLEPMAALLAIKTGRSVKLVMGRDEEFKAGRPGAPSVIWVKMGVKRDGTMTAGQMRVIIDGGAFPGGPVGAATNLGLGPYKVPNLRVEGYDVVTSKPSVGAYRAPGVPQAAFAVEQHVNRLAQAIGMDPLELRLKNITGEGDRLPNDAILPRVGFRTTLETVKNHPLWQKRPNGLFQGRGIACGMWLGGLQPNSCFLKLNADGSLGLMVGTVDLTGTRTSFKQMVASEFQLSPDDVTVTTLDTDTAPYASNSGGSKTTYTMGNAIKQGCDNMKRLLQERAAALLDLPKDQVTYRAGLFHSMHDPSRSVSLKDLGTRSQTTGGGPLLATGSAGTFRSAPSFAAHVVDVEVDPETGKVTILGYWAFQDCGFAVNPTQVEGQMQGGVAQGVGWALTEEYVFANGVMRNPTFLDYRMPTSLDLPLIEPTLVQVPNPESAYGIRGVGEVPIVPPMAAIANAVADATGARITELPMSPERVFWAIHNKTM
ncbi:MAG: xanthine dehydrogenase family protein molybdopterin-binding subunit [Chloroflexi bacterium]|nr:xanthine dehydrogenase family protein molybdopterin-binding subunit [Chloroflexota bacterium]